MKELTDTRLTDQACADCPATVQTRLDQSPVTGEPVRVVVVHHLATWPWFRAYCHSETATVVSEFGVLMHGVADR